MRDPFCRPLAGTGLTARYRSHRLEAVVCHLRIEGLSITLDANGATTLLVLPRFWCTRVGQRLFQRKQGVDRMSGTKGQAFTKSVDTVSIWLKSRGLLPFGPFKLHQERGRTNSVALPHSGATRPHHRRYRDASKAVNRMSRKTVRIFAKTDGTVSIPLKT